MPIKAVIGALRLSISIILKFNASVSLKKSKNNIKNIKKSRIETGEQKPAVFRIRFL